MITSLGYLALLLLLVFLILLGAFVAAPGRSSKTVSPVSRRPVRALAQLGRQMIRGDVELARRLRLDLRAWLVARAAFATVVAIASGVLLGSAATGIFVGALGWLALTWYMRLRAGRRQLQISEALLQWINQVANASRASQSRSLAEILAERARYSGPVLQDVLAPLAAGEGSLRDRLVEVNRRAATPLCAQMVIAILVARSYSPRRFVQVVEEQLAPAMRSDLEVIRENRTTLTESYQQIGIVCVIMVGLFAIALRGEQADAFYATPLGLVTLVAVSSMIAGLIWWASKSVRPVTWVAWDVDGLTQRLEQMSGRV